MALAWKASMLRHTRVRIPPPPQYNMPASCGHILLPKWDSDRRRQARDDLVEPGSKEISTEIY